jgi:hypothetical protein
MYKNRRVLQPFKIQTRNKMVYFFLDGHFESNDLNSPIQYADGYRTVNIRIPDKFCLSVYEWYILG